MSVHAELIEANDKQFRAGQEYERARKKVQEYEESLKEAMFVNDSCPCKAMVLPDGRIAVHVYQYQCDCNCGDCTHLHVIEPTEVP